MTPSLSRALPLAVALVVASTTVVAAKSVFPTEAMKYLSGEVRIGVNGSLPGWSYPGDGSTGFDVALAQFLAEKYDFDLKIVPLNPSERERKLVDGEVKMVISNYSMDGGSTTKKGSERTAAIDFAGPYFKDQSGIMYSQDKLSRAGSYDGIPASLVCTVEGTTATDYTRGTTHTMESQQKCFDALRDESDLRTVGVVTDETILKAYGHVNDFPASPAMWRGENQVIKQERYGIGLPDNRPDLCRELSSAIADFLTDPKGWDKAFGDHLAGSQDVGSRKPSATDAAPCG